MKLNKEQLKAIKHKSGPLLIIAGAGTGKTTVITERIKNLIQKKLANPSEILALTFTEKSAREMETRVDEAMPYGYTQMWIMTFHSFCDRVLRSEALHIGLDPKYRLMSEAISTQLVRDNLFKFKLDYFRPLGNPTKFVGGLIQHFSRLQDENISPKEYLSWVAGKRHFGSVKGTSKVNKQEIKKWLELAHTYKKYEELKVKEGVMDFGDLIVNTLKLFRDRKNILNEYQKKFKYILVDEFQDTNIAQNELVNLLAEKTGNITVVADDNQSIYRFRGAAVSNILQFKKVYPKAKVVTLIKNYRSTQKILDSSYKLIKHNDPDTLEAQLGISKKLISTVSNNGKEVGFIHTDRVENEAERVVRMIKKLNQEEDLSWKDFAILVRANNHADPFVRAFQRLRVPYQFLGPGRLFKQPEIVELISFLKVLYDFDDSVSFYKLLTIDYFDISARDLIKLANYARKSNSSLFEAVENLEGLPISSDSKEKIKKILDIINKQFKLIKTSTAGQLLYNFLESSGLMQELVKPDTADAQKRANNISKFFDKLKTYEVEHEDASIQAVVDWIELSQELGESPLVTDSDWTENNAVNILTVHSSKGLEFPVVFLVNLVAQRFPTTERREQIPIPEELIKEILPKGDYHLEEERRLFYVGMTRAKYQLFLTASNYYGEGKREKKLSPFIFEALGKLVDSREKLENSGKQLSFLDYNNPKSNLPSTNSKSLKIKIDFLSYSQIETFKICPLHYKLRYISKIPTPVSASQSFGVTMHNTLRDFYKRVKEGEKPDNSLLLRLLKENWIKYGYRSKDHERQYFDRGKNYLKGYLKVGFDPKITPAKLEEPFNIQLKNLVIGGIIDRVDRHSDGSIEIIDYKTSEKLPTQREVDKNLQLSFYALAGVNLREAPFGVEVDKVKLSLYFLDKQKKISTIKTKRQLEDAISDIYKAKREIEESSFRCSGHMFCENCEYKMFCSADIE